MQQGCARSFDEIASPSLFQSLTARQTRTQAVNEDVIRSAQRNNPSRIMRIDPCDKLVQCCYGLDDVRHGRAP